MAEGAEDIGDDIEIGNENHAPLGTTLMLDPADNGFFADDAVLKVFPQSLGHGEANGIKVQGHGVTASAIVADSSGGSTIVSSHAGGAPAVDGTSSGLRVGAVRGTNNSGFGVVGSSSGGAGVFGLSLPGTGIGVQAVSADGVGVLAASTHERGGVFLSGASGGGPLPVPGLRTTQGGIAQVRLVPSEASKLPTKGSLGDLFVHLRSSATTPAAVNLYLCVNDQPVQWQQVQLGATKFAGGQDAP